MPIAFTHLVKMPNGDTEIARRGVRVYTILGLRESGDTPEEIAEAYGLSLGAVYEALACAVDHPDGMAATRAVEAAIERQTLMGIPEEIRRGLDLP